MIDPFVVRVTDVASVNRSRAKLETSQAISHTNLQINMDDTRNDEVISSLSRTLMKSKVSNPTRYSVD